MKVSDCFLTLTKLRQVHIVHYVWEKLSEGKMLFTWTHFTLHLYYLYHLVMFSPMSVGLLVWQQQKPLERFPWNIDGGWFLGPDRTLLTWTRIKSLVSSKWSTNNFNCSLTVFSGRSFYWDIHNVKPVVPNTTEKYVCSQNSRVTTIHHVNGKI